TPPEEQVFRDLAVGVHGEHSGELSRSQEGITGDVAQTGGAGEIVVIAAEGGEDDVFDDGLVVGDLAHGAGAGRGVVEAVRGFQSFRVGEIAGAGRTVPQPELGANSVKVADQHFQHTSGNVLAGAAERSHSAGECVYIVLALRL